MLPFLTMKSIPHILASAPVIEAKKQKLIEQCLKLKEKKIIPSLKVILVGDNPASLIYTRNKKKFCEEIGAECEIIKLPASLSEKDFISEVKKIADNKLVHGCFVQLPLPTQLSHIDVGQLIPAEKDVDGFHAQNLYELMKGASTKSFLPPCTPKGIMTLLKFYEIPISGKNIVIVGRSMIVGKPLMLLLTQRDATVTLCHSKTKNLTEITKKADIVVTAIGRANFFTKEYFSPGQIVIDVGINKDKHDKLCGDVDFENVSPMVAHITPVPGGVGPLTILTLVRNLLQASNKI
jgi:methylenetetrahydrofolate dehydrogenase (NADP+)/methenyltetrahydrofolate cyclohydrolase